jgi:hypothetical protein
MKHPEDDVLLSDGHGFLVTGAPYEGHLTVAKELKEVSQQSSSRRSRLTFRPRNRPAISTMLSTRQTSSVIISSTQGSAPEPAQGMDVLSLTVWSISIKEKSRYTTCCFLYRF